MFCGDTSTTPSHILIVGAGVFGLSTALSLLNRPKFNETSITILDSAPTLPNPSGSSVDASRIVRADYASAPYSRLAVEAQKLWRDTTPHGWGGENRYHEPGFLLTCDAGQEDYVKAAIATVRTVAVESGMDITQIQELPDKTALCRGSGYDQVSGDKGYLNKSSGWADAEACVNYVLDRTKREGGTRVTVRSGTKVDRLVYADASPKSRCTGVQLKDGEIISSDLTVVAAGAWSPCLLNLQGRALATGQALSYIKITEQEQKDMEHRPTVMNLSQGMFIIPPRNQELKIARHGFGYRNMKHVNIDNDPDKENEVSVPAVGIAIPPEGMVACKMALKAWLPHMADRPFYRTRVCWYCDTCVLHLRNCIGRANLEQT